MTLVKKICLSIPCNGPSVVTKGKVYEVRKGTTDCPKCNSILIDKKIRHFATDTARRDRVQYRVW